MVHVKTTTGQGAYGTEAFTMAVRSDYNPALRAKRAVLYCHGGNGTAYQGVREGATFPSTNQLMRAIVMAGYPVFAADMGGTAFGNDATLAAMSAYYDIVMTFGVGNPGGKAGGVFIVGHSMGGLTALNFARANKAKVAGCVLLQPLMNVQDVKSRNVLGLASTVDAAYGGAYNNGTHGLTHNPFVYAGADLASGVDAQVWYSSDDATVIPASTVTPVLAAMGSHAEAHPMPGAHADAFIGGVNPAAVLTWMAARN
jgi:alpha-beta hydrolase superfamily lysophospholipase